MSNASMTNAGVRVEVTAGSRLSTIWIGNGISERLPELLDAHGVGARRFIVSSPVIWQLHGARLQESLGRVEPILLPDLSLIHISEPTRLLSISYAVFCLKKKK